MIANDHEIKLDVRFGIDCHGAVFFAREGHSVRAGFFLIDLDLELTNFHFARIHRASAHESQ